MPLFTPAELSALVGLFGRTPMSLAEQQFVMVMMNRLAAFCQPSEPKPQEVKMPFKEPTADVMPCESQISEEQAQAMVDGLAAAEALD